MKKPETTNDKQKLKKIGDCLIQYTQQLERDGEHLILEIFITPELKEVLKEVTIDELTEVNLSYLLDQSFKRYKIKSVINRGLYNQHKEILFFKKLIDNRKIKLKVRTDKQAKSILMGLQQTLRELTTIYYNLQVKLEIRVLPF